MNKTIAYKNSKKLTMFNPAAVDDYGFTPEEFRVFARVMRRCSGQNSDGFTEGIPSLAKQLQMSQALVRRALNVLVACNALTRKPRPGKTDLYDFNTCDKWVSSNKLREIRASLTPVKNDRGKGANAVNKQVKTTKSSRRSKKATTPDENERGTPYENDTTTPVEIDTSPLTKTTDEGIPSEGYPPEGTHTTDINGGEKDVCAVSFGTFKKELETWYCPKFGMTTFQPDTVIDKQIEWLIENKFSLADIQGFHRYAIKEKWRDGPVNLSAILKGIGPWKASQQTNGNGNGSSPPRYCDVCRETSGMVEVKGKGWAKCLHPKQTAGETGAGPCDICGDMYCLQLHDEERRKRGEQVNESSAAA